MTPVPSNYPRTEFELTEVICLSTDSKVTDGGNVRFRESD